MPAKNTRFTVLQLMAATVVIAVFCVALFFENEWWRATLGTITMAMILNSLLASIFTKGERRAFHLSFFVGALFFVAGAYTYVASLPYMLTMKFLELITEFTPNPPNEENFLIVATIFWLQVMCFSSACLGRSWFRRAKAEKQDELSDCRESLPATREALPATREALSATREELSATREEAA